VTVAVAIAVLASGHRILAQADAGLDEDGHGVTDADVVEGEIADEFGGAPGAIDETINARS
jgi:ACDE family multidrug resistance protein